MLFAVQQGDQPTGKEIAAVSSAAKVTTSVDAAPPPDATDIATIDTATTAASTAATAGTSSTAPAPTATSVEMPIAAPKTTPATPSSSAKSLKSPVNTSNTSSSAEGEELQAKLSKVGVLNQLMKGYSQLKQTIDADTTTQAYLADLEAHHSLPVSEYTLYAGDETYIEHPSGAIRPIKETMQAVQRSVHALIFGLNHELKYPKISFMNFKAGDIALFMPSVPENRKIWMAYHASSPYRYLAEVSIALLCFLFELFDLLNCEHVIDLKCSHTEFNVYHSLSYVHTTNIHIYCHIHMSGVAGGVPGAAQEQGPAGAHHGTHLLYRRQDSQPGGEPVQPGVRHGVLRVLHRGPQALRLKQACI